MERKRRSAGAPRVVEEYERERPGRPSRTRDRSEKAAATGNDTPTTSSRSGSAHAGGKRKLAAGDQADEDGGGAKRRQSRHRERSEKPDSVADEPPPPPPLPTSVQAGKPLPTVEDAQTDDLSAKEYQSVGER